MQGELLLQEQASSQIKKPKKLRVQVHKLRFVVDVLNEMIIV